MKLVVVAPDCSEVISSSREVLEVTTSHMEAILLVVAIVVLASSGMLKGTLVVVVLLVVVMLSVVVPDVTQATSASDLARPLAHQTEAVPTYPEGQGKLILFPCASELHW